MRAVGVIPARFASVRFPGKVLHPIAGVPMLERVYRGAVAAKRLERVLVATDDARVVEAARGFGAEARLTSPDHATGTDRLAELAASLDAEILVNIQGDEPLVEGYVVDAAVEALCADPDAVIGTVAHGAEPDAAGDPNRVKVVLGVDGRALYFSRSPIPARRGPAAAPLLQHVGIYAYHRQFLLDFVRLPRTPAERSEELEQLRALEHGYRIRVALVEGWRGVAVDVPEDVARVEARLRELGRC